MAIPVTIEEIGGDRSISLNGRAVPDRGVDYGRRLRNKVTWYGGNAVGSVQVLGPEEMPTTMTGQWMDRHLTGQVRLTGFTPLESEDFPAQALVAAMESLQLAGRPLRVEWGPLVRMGIIANVSIKWLRERDCVWTVEWVWYGRDDLEVPRTSSDEAPTAAPVRRRLDATQDQQARQPSTLRRDYRAAVAQRISDARQRVVQVFDTIRATQRSATIPFSAALSMDAQATTIRDQVADLSGDLVETPVTQATENEGVTDRLVVERWRRGLGREADRMGAEVVRTARQMRALTNPRPIGVYTVRQGDDLRRISLRFYRTADEWPRLMVANGLNDSAPATGTVLLIPPLSIPIDALRTVL
jgi:hypothetical protein